jgi:anti-anti-sigma regulatory factor
MSPLAKLDIENLGKGRFRLIAVIDIVTVEVFETHYPTFESVRGPVTLDFSRLTFLDSTGIRGLLRLADRLGERELVIDGPNGNVYRTLSIAGIDGQNGIRIKRDG